jgi:alkylation response protein AidB-like acyl-CoA dehydrogenase
MNFGAIRLTASDEVFAHEVEEFLAANWHTPEDAPLALDHERAPRGLVAAMGDRGWIYPALPRDQGGADLDPIKELILSSLLAERGVPAAGDTLVPPAIVEYGSQRLKDEILPLIRTGRAGLCLGYSEPDSGSDMAAARTRAIPDGDDWIINGSKMFTTFAHTSDYVFLLARTDPSASKHRGLTMFLVPLDHGGVEIRPLYAMGDVRTNVTYYRDVRIPDWYRIGPVGDGWSVVSGPLQAEHGSHERAEGLVPFNSVMGANFADILERLLRIACGWAQTEGIDDDPVVRNYLAELALDIEAARNYSSDFGKALAAETFQHHADALVDLIGPQALGPDAVGGGAFTWARAFAPGTAIYGGTTEIYRNNYARSVLKLPRPPATR